MGKARQDYLQKKWMKYPTTPRNALAMGRVLQGKLGNTLILEHKAYDAEQYTACDILVDGDLIAIMPEEKFVLLAPNLTTSKSDKWQKIKRWNLFLREIRYFFDRKNFLQISTPTLVVCPGTEPSLEPFKTQFVWGNQKKDFYLPTSPELNLKKMLVAGVSGHASNPSNDELAIYEIAKVFRNGEETERHLPEFHMLEWYRAFYTLDRIKEDVVSLIYSMAEYLNVDKPKDIKTYSIAELFKIHCDFNFTPETKIEDFKQLAHKINVDVLSAEVIDDYFYLIFSEKIEPFLPKNELIFVEKYPPYQAALARCDHEGWAERFEVYWRGLELANAFHELNDPEVQRLRAVEDLEKKRLQGREEVSLDEDFFKALEYGMPPSSGIALGIERLYMALSGTDNIKDITG